MEFAIKYFGIIAEITQKTEEVFFSEEQPISLKRLQSKIEMTYPKVLVINYSIAVNQKFLQNDILLKNGDVIALLPAFAGG